ncbi:hypothetical protein GALL_455480 [mine drainage metagenome]|jgi:transcriptional regulator with XRE-family HTH domain|uniref:HTH cro/C1-type domain-containing protein n=1 Tax=mine drainage metagenome TaxID=410659 RepID=A0A1J5PPT8_9ZZZZ
MDMNALLDHCKAATGCKSDYKLAEKIGVTRSAISAMRRHQSPGLSDETACKIADLLNVNPLAIIAPMRAEQATTADARNVWVSLIQKLQIKTPVHYVK